GMQQGLELRLLLRINRQFLRPVGGGLDDLGFTIRVELVGHGGLSNDTRVKGTEIASILGRPAVERAAGRSAANAAALHPPPLQPETTSTTHSPMQQSGTKLVIAILL